MKSAFAIFFSLFLLFVLSCTKDKREKPIEPAPVDTTKVVVSDCDSTKVLYCNSVKSIINTRCAVSGCHVSGGSGIGNMSTYNGLKAKVDDGSFTLRVFTYGDMPPSTSSQLTATDTITLRQWLNSSALEK